MHSIRVYADTAEAVQSAGIAINARYALTWPFGSGFVGIIGIEELSQRRDLRNNPNILLLPHPAASADISKHAQRMKISAKTARDIHAAVFSALDVDHFDPDLLS